MNKPFEQPFYCTLIQLLVKSGPMYEDKIWEEISLAVTCNTDGQPGKARVLARRAVGKACQSLLKSKGLWHPRMSALDSISELSRASFIKRSWEPILSHFLLHVNEDHNLPGEIDLVDEAAYLILELTQMTLTRSNSDGED